MSSTATEAPSFSPKLFAFLKDLAANNDRAWFNANKARYVEEVQEPALAFIEDADHLLRQISPHFPGDPRTNGGSLFRIYRDTRFAKDKTPYKTHTGIQFRHERGKTAHAPCFYLHLEPGNVFIGAGVWRPEGETLRAIRAAIAARPDRWREVTSEPGFTRSFSLGGDALKRPPAGFDPDNPAIEDIKRKDFIAVAGLTQKEVTGGGFLERFEGLCRDSAPFVRFLCDASGVPF